MGSCHKAKASNWKGPAHSPLQVSAHPRGCEYQKLNWVCKPQGFSHSGQQQWRPEDQEPVLGWTRCLRPVTGGIHLTYIDVFFIKTFHPDQSEKGTGSGRLFVVVQALFPVC